MTETMREIVLAARPEGAPKDSDFRLEESAVPTPGPGEILVRVIWLSLDPYMRGRMDESKSYAAAVPIGGRMEGGAVGEVIASNNDRFRVGDIVTDRFGWGSHAVVDGRGAVKIDPAKAPIQTAVGVLGMPGLTAYVGLNDHGKPQAGETLVVGAATGAVGTVVGQLAKIYGLRVVGVAGGAEKCDFAVKELGFDACLDHKAYEDGKDLGAALSKACPDGIDIYFENVSGKTLDAVIPLLNVHARIPLCGMISQYNMGGFGIAGGEGADRLPKLWRTLLVQRVNVRGFIITDHYDRFGAFHEEVSGHIRDGRLTYRETVAEGLENAPSAFMSMLNGGNFGKQLVRVGPDA